MGTPGRAPGSDAPPERPAHGERSSPAGTGLGFLGAPASLRRPSRIDAPSVAETDHEADPNSSTYRPVGRSPVPALHPVGDA